ncbi:hypothetical protein L226DRAFT_574392 [Lentinus tigrinus ALCF2SS1-7]|uniref:uncharacterized protein n=1 Tax=Lentinus tigrinus ALCF2SS1-7 TaxID=1328758 RepID=UPI0011661B83|nr:hypothetical protein L226DRAFT_574392 [Lentinus tigrinus ALCF2SS1-7]
MAATISRSSTFTERYEKDLHAAVGGKIDLHSEPIYTGFKKAIESDTVQNATRSAIEDLNSTVKDIRKAFRKIRQDLQRFDKERFEDKNGAVLQLSPEWDELHEHFLEILDISRENAIEAAAFMQQYTNTMLQDVKESDYPALKEELSNFAVMLSKKEEKAGTAKTEFSKLADNVYLFSTKIDLVLEDADTNIKEQIHKAQHRIADLHVRLKRISEKTTQLATACIASFATAALGVGLAIVTLSPEAFVLAIRISTRNARISKTSTIAFGKSASGLSNLMHEKKGAKADLEDSSKEILQLIERQDTLAQIKTSVEQTKLDIKQLSSQINTFVNIWNALKHDLHSFNEQLDYAVNPDVQINKFFPKKIANTRELYKTLIGLLEEYAKGSVDREDEETLCNPTDATTEA